jgi:hypothetical protein
MFTLVSNSTGRRKISHAALAAFAVAEGESQKFAGQLLTITEPLDDPALIAKANEQILHDVFIQIRAWSYVTRQRHTCKALKLRVRSRRDMPKCE